MSVRFLAIAEGLIRNGQLRAARDFLERRPARERNSYRFVNSWSELLWSEKDSEGLLRFANGLPRSTADHAALSVLNKARSWMLQSKFREAIDLAVSERELLRSANDKTIEARVLTSIGRCWAFLKETENAVESYERALRIFESEDDELRCSDCLSAMGFIRRASNDWNGALALYSQAILIQKRHGQVLQTATPTLNRGAIHLFQGRFGVASDDFLRAGQVAGSYSWDALVISSQTAMGLLCARTGDYSSSVQWLAKSLIQVRRDHRTRPFALASEYIGELRFRQGRLSSARRWLGRGIEEGRIIGLRDIENESRCRLAEVELAEGNTDLAESLVREALDNFVSMDDLYEIAVCRRVLGQILLRRGKKALAEVEFTKAMEFFSEVGEIYESKKIALLRAEGPSADLHSVGKQAKDPGVTESTDDTATSSSVSPSEPQTGTDTVGSSIPVNGASEARETPKARPGRKFKKPRRDANGKLPTHPNFPSLITASAVFLETLEKVSRLAKAEASILILGESGTGKEAIARGVHRLSERADHRFVPFNCSTSSADMFDAEFYGHAKGAFTDARESRAGLAKSADNGTLFLDEIGDMDHSLQTRILRFLDTGEIRPVGSDYPEHLNVRVVSATNRDLSASVKSGAFRHDLRFRLSEMTLRIPPLRDRGDDIDLLAEHYLEEAHKKGVGHVRGIARPVLNLMHRYSWPGNVRELRNEIFRLVAEAAHGGTIDSWRRPAQEWPTNEVNEERLRAELSQSRGNVADVGRATGLSRVSLYRFFRKYGINPSDYRAH